MSFESLVKKLMKEGKSKTAATKIAGSVANAKMKGAGSGPTAKQKARAKSPATKKPKPRAVIRDKDRVADKSRSYTDKKGRKIEIKTFKSQKKYDSGVKDDPNKPSMKRKSSRLANTVELHKTKTKKDGTTKTKVKRAAGGGKKSQRLHTKFAKGKNKEGSSDVTITRKSPTTMKKQGYNARLDDSLGAKNGKKKQSMKSRRDESEGMEKKMGNKKFSGNKSSAQGKVLREPSYADQGKVLREPSYRGVQAKAPTKMSNKRKVKAVAKAKGFPTKTARGKNRATKEQKMEVKKAMESMSKSPAKKPLVGKQKSLPKELQEAILKSPGKMLSKSGIKMMDKSPAKSVKIKPQEKGSTSKKERVKIGGRKNKIVKKQTSKSPEGNVTAKTKTIINKKTGNIKQVQKKKVGNKTVKKLKTNSPINMKTPMKKSKQKVEQDYARNAIADYKSGKKKEARYEKKRELEVAAGESPAKLKKPSKKKKTYSSSKIDPNYHNQASKTVSTQGGARYGEGKTKTKFVDSDSPYHDRNYKSRESLTKTKTVNKGYGQSGRSTTKETQKSISPKRADRMRSRFRKGLEKQSPSMMKTNQDGGGYAAKNMAAPARQLKKLGSVLSKHFKSNI